MIRTVALSENTEFDFNENGNDPYFYISNPYCWVKNLSDDIIYVSLTDDISAGADGTASASAGEAVMIALDSGNKIYLSGDGNAEIYTASLAICPYEGGGHTEQFGIYPMNENGTFGETIYFPNGITEIPSYFFYGNGTDQYIPYNNIKEIYLPEGVTSIGAWAFCGAQNVEEVFFPDSLISIDQSAFRTVRLKRAVLPEGFTTIGNSVFYACTSLRSIYLPSTIAASDSLTLTNGNYFMQGCTALENITLGNGWKNSLRCNTSNNLTHDSILAMFNALGNVSGKTLTLGSTNLAKMTDAEKAIATEKGWTLA